EAALGWAERLRGEVGGLKVGLELFVSEGPGLVRDLVGRGWPVFLDLKFHDIPATMAGAARAAGRLGVRIVNVHALAGPEGMARAAEAAREGAREEGFPPPLVLAVTVLTSHGPDDLDALGLAGPPASAVGRLAALARGAGCDGVVASAEEAPALRAAWPEAVILTPGIRPAGADRGDQTRVATPAGAVRAGADHLVVGRPIRQAPDPVAAARRIVAEVAGALGERS
ncbi:MAG: orotidine-5'-phosphate decarboxylase, partial [Candidatus Dadabacteria bacterium]